MLFINQHDENLVSRDLILIHAAVDWTVSASFLFKQEAFEFWNFPSKSVLYLVEYQMTFVGTLARKRCCGMFELFHLFVFQEIFGQRDYSLNTKWLFYIWKRSEICIKNGTKKERNRKKLVKSEKNIFISGESERWPHFTFISLYVFQCPYLRTNI